MVTETSKGGKGEGKEKERRRKGEGKEKERRRKGEGKGKEKERVGLQGKMKQEKADGERLATIARIRVCLLFFCWVLPFFFFVFGCFWIFRDLGGRSES